MKNFIEENNLAVHVLTSELEGKHYAMVATWICPASLRTDELRFTLPLSKYNDSAKAIIGSKNFILHKLTKKSFETAFKMGSSHSSEVDKFHGEEFQIHASGARVLKSALASGYAKVITHMETEDRYILYCSLSEIKSNIDNESPLTQGDLFAQLREEDRKTLGAKYLSDCNRDTPKA